MTRRGGRSPPITTDARYGDRASGIAQNRWRSLPGGPGHQHSCRFGEASRSGRRCPRVQMVVSNDGVAADEADFILTSARERLFVEMPACVASAGAQRLRASSSYVSVVCKNGRGGFLHQW